MGRMSESAVAYSSMSVGRESEVSDARITAQLSYLREQLNHLRDYVSKLTEKLEPVLLPSYPETSDMMKSPAPSLASPLSEEIDSLNRIIAETISQINTVANRVQL